MDIKTFVKKELSNWGKYERVIFPLLFIFIIVTSICIKDNIIALISAVFGMSYTILAGKGKISCYFFGLLGTLCYAYISFVNGFFGNLVLYLFYYFPMQVFGIFKWKDHLKESTNEIVKTCLTNKERAFFLFSSFILILICYFVLKSLNDSNPIIDAITSILSICGLILTVKRAIEQWVVWFIVNGLSCIMWIKAYFEGSNCFATIFMWFVYFVLSIYFLYVWKKEMTN